MTNGNERLERIEGILERVANRQEQLAKQLATSQEQAANTQEQLAKQLATSQEQAAKSHEQVDKSLDQVAKRLEEMAARQQYHDEAFERHDTEMKAIRGAIAADAENIRALVRVAEFHHRRLEGLEGGEAV